MWNHTTRSAATMAVAGAGDRHGHIGCPHCGIPLPLRLCREDEPTAQWECDSCNTRMAAAFVPELAAHMAGRVRLSQVHFDTYNSPPIPPVLGELVTRWALHADKNWRGPERRQDGRFTDQIDAAVIGLDELWMPQHEPVRVLVVNLSSGGLGMIARSIIKAPLIVVQMQGLAGSAQFLSEVIWSDHVGCGFHHVGARFIHRLGQDR